MNRSERNKNISFVERIAMQADMFRRIEGFSLYSLIKNQLICIFSA